MVLINGIGIVVILLNLIGLLYLLFIGFRNIANNYKKDLNKIKIQPKSGEKEKSENINIITEKIIKEKDDMLDDLDLSDFDDLNLDDFD
jgi:hypothetical protein